MWPLVKDADFQMEETGVPAQAEQPKPLPEALETQVQFPHAEPTVHLSPSSWVLGYKVVLLHCTSRTAHSGIFFIQEQGVIPRGFLAPTSVSLSMVELLMADIHRSCCLFWFLFSRFSCRAAAALVLCQLVSRGSIWTLKNTLWPEMRDKCSFSIFYFRQNQWSNIFLVPYPTIIASLSIKFMKFSSAVNRR